MYSTLMYASIRKPECDQQEISKILGSARRNNSKIDVTGVLLYDQKKFLQYLKGDFDMIHGLYQSIKTDDRHKNVIMISNHKNSLDYRLFPSWAMGEKNMDSGSIDFHNLDRNTKLLFNEAINGRKLASEKSIQLINKLMGLPARRAMSTV